MLMESRVVAVRDDGRQLIVARFHVGDPKPCPEPSGAAPEAQKPER
jgi:hypothetical protein